MAALVISREVVIIALVPGTLVQQRSIGTCRLKRKLREKMLSSEANLQLQAPGGESGRDGAG